jgi:hypothetical protein
MSLRAGIVLCILLFLAFSASVDAITIRDVKLSQDPVDYRDQFEVTARLNDNPGNLVAFFYVDRGEQQPYLFATMNVPSEAEEITGKFKLTAEDWDYQNIKCGTHNARVDIQTTVTHAVVATMSVPFDIGQVPDVEFEPSRPVSDRDVKVTLRDKITGNVLPNVDVIAKDIYGGDAIDKRTDLGGSFVMTPKASGEYHMIFGESDICGEITFYAKRPLIIDGPRPDNPVINEMVIVGVPAGASVGVKILDSKGDVYKTPPVSYSGGSNFSISEPGTYILIVGDNSTKYWSVNKTFVVSDRLVPEIQVAPSEAVVGKTATITVSSRGQPLGGATVTVKKPDGVDRDYTTSDYGTINYDSMSATGTYFVKVTKERYGVGGTSFEAKHSFTSKFDPEFPTVKDPITLSVKDQNDKAVSDVLVEIPSSGFKRVTDMGGKISFNLQEPTVYQIKLSKDLFWDKTIQLTPYGILSVGECLSEFELGGAVTISAFDSFKAPVSTDISVKDPNGLIQHYTSQSQLYTPAKPGQYVVTVSKTNYIDANLTFKVYPHPLDISTRMKNGQLMVNVTSRNSTVSQVKVSLRKGDAVMNGTTNEAGQAWFNLNNEGNITVTANPAGENALYVEKSLSQRIVRSYDLILLTTPLIIIAGITLLTIVAIQLGRMYLGSEWKMPSFGLGKQAIRTKHDSTLLGDNKPKKSRLSNI